MFQTKTTPSNFKRNSFHVAWIGAFLADNPPHNRNFLIKLSTIQRRKYCKRDMRLKGGI
jgi:hypothetical protein